MTPDLERRLAALERGIETMNSSPYPMQVVLPVIGIDRQQVAKKQGCEGLGDTIQVVLSGWTLCTGCYTAGSSTAQFLTGTMDGVYTLTKTIGAFGVQWMVSGIGSWSANRTSADCSVVFEFLEGDFDIVITCQNGRLTAYVYNGSAGTGPGGTYAFTGSAPIGSPIPNDVTACGYGPQVPTVFYTGYGGSITVT